MIGTIFGNLAWNSRTKIYLGNPVKWRYALQGYGIPTEMIPSTDTGNIKLVNLKQWIKVKKYNKRFRSDIGSSNENKGNINISSCESTSTTQMMNNAIVECPRSKDVLFRRGKQNELPSWKCYVSKHY